MRKYTDEDIEKAKELRKTKLYSFAKLQRATGIPATTIGNWCHDAYVGTKWDTLLRTTERRRQKLKSSEITAVNSINNINPALAKILASLIYWCEGGKYPSSSSVTLVNSDSVLLEVFITLLRTAYDLDESKFRAHLQIHDIHDYKEVRRFWSKLLNIPKSQFIKPTITKVKGGKHRKDYKGTCMVKYRDYRILLKLTDIYEAFAAKINRETLLSKQS